MGEDPGALPVELESVDGDTVTLNVAGLRFNVELEIGGGPDTVCVLCTVRGCPHPAVARARIARYCDTHLGHVDQMAMTVLGIPPAGDDRAPGWQEQVARDIRDIRLNRWEQEIVEAVDKLKTRNVHRLARHRDRAAK